MQEKRSSKKQRELLTFVDGFIQGHGYGPSYREIMKALNYKSVSTVATHIDGLIAKGYLQKHDKSARSLEVVTTHFNDKVIKPITSSSQEKWLINIINKKFQSLEQGNNQALDDIYVLVGALKVLELNDAYIAMRAKLTDYLKRR